MMFERVANEHDPVVTYHSADGFYRLRKNPSKGTWTLLRSHIGCIMGERICEYDSLEEALADLADF